MPMKVVHCSFKPSHSTHTSASSKDTPMTAGICCSSTQKENLAAGKDGGLPKVEDITQKLLSAEDGQRWLGLGKDIGQGRKAQKHSKRITSGKRKLLRD